MSAQEQNHLASNAVNANDVPLGQHNTIEMATLVTDKAGLSSKDQDGTAMHTVQKEVSEIEKYRKGNNGSPFFGLPPYQSPYSGTRSYNYAEKYPPDPLGHEFKENARVWKVYLDEAENYDDEMLKGFKDTIDSLLIFAALFSAVVTTFVVSTAGSLQPDYSQITATLLAEQVQLIRAAGNQTAIDNVSFSAVNLESISPSRNDLWINGLFFTSLSLSLVTALLSVLVKQWLQAYSSISSGNAKERAVIRQFRFSGLVKWKVPVIIGMLPLILHTSLALFLVGLSLYVRELHPSLCWIVIAITVFAFAMYMGSVFLTAIWLECPYRIPLLFKPVNYILHIFTAFRTYSSGSGHFPSSLKEAELDFLTSLDKSAGNSSTLDVISTDILAWMCTLQSNSSIQEIVLQALHGLFTENVALSNGINESYWAHYNFLNVVQSKINPYLNLLSQVLNNALADINENYKYEIWPSLALQWMKVADLDSWPAIEPQIIKNSLIQATKRNDETAVRKIIEIMQLNRSKFPISDWNSNTLYLASELGHMEACKVLIDNRAKVKTSKEGVVQNAVLVAAANSKWDVVQFLIENARDIEVKEKEYLTICQMAVVSGKTNIIQLLLLKG
ncbi:hypothetical protein GYMLUDRAFT_841952, partial [Collybiopsis luxurians FD-317 M1]